MIFALIHYTHSSIDATGVAASEHGAAIGQQLHLACGTDLGYAPDQYD